MIAVIVGSIGWVLAGVFFGIIVGEKRIAAKVLDELRNGPLDKIDGQKN